MKKNVFIILVIFIAIGAYFYFAAIEFSNKADIKNANEVKNIFSGTPEIDVLPNDPDISIVIFTGFKCSSCGVFFSETYPLLKKEYVDNNKAKIYFKRYITRADFEEKTPEYELSRIIFCSENLSDEDYVSFAHLDEDGINKKIDEIKTKNPECIKNVDEEIIHEINLLELLGINSEPTYYVGIRGKDNTVLQGIPSPERLRTSIRQKEILLGRE